LKVNNKPAAVDTSGVDLSENLFELAELLARNSHRHWSKRRLSEGWRFGPAPDYAKKEHPDLVPYEDLPDSEKAYDRSAAIETLRAIIALGYRIEKTGTDC
jgi:hypothetical protein